MKTKFTAWYESVTWSRSKESLCGGHPTPPSPPPPPPAPAPAPSHGCDWHLDTGLNGKDIKSEVVASKEECCELCKASPRCVAADFNKVYVPAGVPNPDGVYLDSMEEDLNHF